MLDADTQNTMDDSMHEARVAIPTSEELDTAFDAIHTKEYQSGSTIDFTSISNLKAPEEYATMKGIKATFPNKSGKLLSGRLVEWDDDNRFIVVGFDGDTLVANAFNATSLYNMPENSKLKGAVEFCRIHANEVEQGRSQIRSMLSSVRDSQKEQSAA